MEALAAHARQKNVASSCGRVEDVATSSSPPRSASRSGRQGIKVDFMQRDDQPLIGFYHRICREAAKRRCWSTSTAPSGRPP